MKLRNLLRKIRKVIAILLALSLPFSVLAQGGLFQRGEEPESIRNSGETLLTNQGFGNPIGGNNLTNQTFGEETPLGSGLLFILMAGAGYAALKTNKKTNKK